ncbi:MAG: protein translocase subunit SecD [Phycisphaerae bacterium]
MNDPNRLFKWIFVIVLVAFALLALYPPHEKLKGGIDLVGGTSLLYEIDTTGLTRAQKRDLPSRVMAILKERVDPSGQLNIEWRPIGASRLEIRMPHPPKEALRRREAKEQAVRRIRDEMNIGRSDIERALESGADLDTLVSELSRGVAERAPLVEALVKAFAARTEADVSGDQTAIRDARQAYEEAMGEVLETNLPVVRLTDVLAMGAGPGREKELDRLRAEFPSYDAEATGKPITSLMEAYDDWAGHKAELEESSDLKRRIQGAGVLEFRILADRDLSAPTFIKSAMKPELREPIAKYTKQLSKFGPRPRGVQHYRWFKVEDIVKFMRLDDVGDFDRIKESSQQIVERYAGNYYVLAHNDREFGMTKAGGGNRPKWQLRSAFANNDPMSGETVVSFTLDPRGGRLFGALTGANVNRQLCIFLDDTAVSHANINERITSSGQIKGGFSTERAQELALKLEAGALPARLRDTPLVENTIGPSLGETNRTHGFRAASLGLAAVIVFVLLYYGITAGGMADIALLMNLLFVLAIMALMQATFTLPGIAGLILTVGMAVDANVLIFERIREERDRGVVFRKALNAGYDKALSTIIDANLTTLLTCVILGFFGSEEVKGFALVLGIGITTSMFTALFVTRLVFNTLLSAGWIKDFSMRRIIAQPSINWLALRSKFWPISTVAVVAGMGLFLGIASTDRESVFDIEFLGGTSVQVDLKPGHALTDVEVRRRVTSTTDNSSVTWLRTAADALAAATASTGESGGAYTLTSDTLSGHQLVTVMRSTMEPYVVHDGLHADGGTATFDMKPGQVSRLDEFKSLVAGAAKATRDAADRLRSARVQSVRGPGDAEEAGLSYEIVTVVQDRALVQEALMVGLGKDNLRVQTSVQHHLRTDTAITMADYFVIEDDDEYLSDVLGGDAGYSVLDLKGGAAVEVSLAPDHEGEAPPVLSVAAIERRLREIGLQPEFEQYQLREPVVFPLGAAVVDADGEKAYSRFAVATVDKSMPYSDNEDVWAENVAEPLVAQVHAALGREKSLSKVVQFAGQIAEQTQMQALFAVGIALLGIVAYVWLRFGTKEFGLAAIVALVHDVAITLGLVTLTHFVHDTVVGKALALSDFKIDLPMIAAVMTVIGYSLNDTIVVFDRIRENRGRVGSLNPGIINTSISQTLSRTLLTSITTFLVVVVLYAIGGQGVHGFSFALLIGVVVGTYSSIGVAAPLLYQPKLLHRVVLGIIAFGAVATVFVAFRDTTARLVAIGVLAVIFVVVTAMRGRRAAYDGVRPVHA